MLFLLKRTVPTALGALLLLTALGLALRHARKDRATPLHFTPTLVLLGVAAVGVLVSDVLIHGALLLVFGDAYRKRHVALAGVFRGQTLPCGKSHPAAGATGSPRSANAVNIVSARRRGIGSFWRGRATAVYGAAAHTNLIRCRP
jgi:hypothetical protein